MRQLRGLFSAALAGHPSTRLIAGLIAIAVMMLGTGTALRAQGSTNPPPAEFKVGDVAVAIPNGKVQIYNASGTLVDTLTVGSGEVGGCAFDSTYRLRCVDFGDGTEVKFALQYPFGATQNLPVTPANPQSILYSGAANDFIVGFAGDTGTVNEYDYGGSTLEKSCSQLPVDSSTAFWTDISSDGSTIYYTSGLGNGHKASVRTLVPSNNCATNTLFSASNKTGAVPAGQGFFGLRLLTGNDSDSGDFLLANGDGVMLVNSGGGLLYTYTANLPQGDWRSVWLSPDGQSFWSVNLADGKLYEFNIADGTVEASFQTGASSSGDDAGGIAVEGGNSAAQPMVQSRVVPLSVNLSDGTATGTACFYDPPAVPPALPCTPTTNPPPANANQVEVTLENFSLKGTAPAELTVRFTEIDNSTKSSVGTSDTGLPCLVESNSTTNGGMCTVWEIESSGASFTHNNLLFSSPQTPSASDNPVLLLNEATDFTSLQGGDIFIQGGSDGGFSVFSQNNLLAGTDVSSGWENPITDTADNSFNWGSNIKFQFYLTNSSGGVVPTSSFNCSTSPTENCPELRLSLLQSGEAPELITSDTASNEGNSGTATLIFRPISSTEWGVNLDTSTVPKGCYVATGVDPQDRFVPFSYSSATKPSTTILAIGVPATGPDSCTSLAQNMGLLGP